MKRWYLIFSMLLAGYFLQAQENQIVFENKVWSNMQENCQPEATYYTTFFHKFGSDTLLNGRSYKKVMIAEDESAEAWFFAHQFVREANQRVYLLNEFGDEMLLYDFSIVPGETVVIGNELVPDGIHLTFTGIDSVETASGWRERWKLEKDEFSPPEYWIAGIGSESGVLNSGTGVFGGLCGSYTLLCYSEDNLEVYQNPFFGTCYYNLLDDGNNIKENQSTYKVVYQSSSNLLTVNWEENDTRQIMLTDIQGRQHYNQHSSRSAELNTSRLKPGIYVLIVTSATEVSSRKIMIY